MESCSKKTPRRRALSPKTTPYSSPFQTVELLNPDIEDLKSRLLESESIIGDLRTERDNLQTQLQNASGLNESLIIKTSNRVSTQETRIFTRNQEVLQNECREKQDEIRKLKMEIDRLEIAYSEEKTKSEQNAEVQKEQLAELERLRQRVHQLEEAVFEKKELIREMEVQMELERKEHHKVKMELENSRMQWNAEKEGSKAVIEELVEDKRVSDTRASNLLKEVERLQIEIQKSQEASKFKSILHEKDQHEVESSRQVLSEVRQLSSRLENLTTPVRKVDRREADEYLKMSAKVIGETMDDLKRRNSRMERELEERGEELRGAKEEVTLLKKTLEQRLGDADMATKMLHEENTKFLQLTRQKADIRCELLAARRQLGEFPEKITELEKARDVALEEVRKLQEKLKNREEEVEEMSQKLMVRSDEMDELKGKLAKLEGLKSQQSVLEAELARKTDKMNQMGKCLAMADQQCERLSASKQSAEASRKRAIDQCNEMVVKIRNLETAMQSQRKTEVELTEERSVNARLTEKLRFMEEEIRELHSDYRQELAKMAENKEKREKNEIEGDQLRLQISHNLSQLRSANNTAEQAKAEAQRLQKTLDEVRAKQSSILEENVRLRKGMADALAKIEEYKGLWETEKEQRASEHSELVRMEKRVGKLDDELAEKTQRIEESEQTVSYLHSQINAKHSKQPKLGRRSTLLSTVSEMDTTVYRREAEEVAELEKERTELLKSLAEKRRVLADSKSATTVSTTVETTTTVTPITPASKSATELMAVMRHDIPHKWNESRHLGVFSIKCSLCFQSIPTLHKVKKCTHCEIHVHSTCAPRVNNTCGMPLECANYYQQHVGEIGGVENGRMNGWVRVYRDDVPGSTWISAWALMDVHKMSFYTSDGTADLSSPFFSVDLEKEQWVLRTDQTIPHSLPNDIKGGGVTSLLCLKMPRGSVYILAASQPSARRWAQCLQTAQRKRMMLRAAESAKQGLPPMADYECMLVLDSPNNLRIFKAITLEDWIVFATATGLFYTSISSPRPPIRIAGPSSVTSLEIMAEIKCIAMVVNSNCQLALAPIETLTLAIQSTQPSIRPQILPEFTSVSSIRYHQQGTHRFLLIADETHLHIRKYNATKDVFSQFAKLPVTEPITFLQSLPTGIIFSSDTFYFISLSSHLTSSDHSSEVTARQLRPPGPSDFPISAMPIGDSEILLAYQNHGVFVNLRGEVTRNDVIEWEKMPLEFTYTAPHLFIIHDDSIEILEILSHGCAQLVASEREVFECHNAHVIGRQFEDSVLISVSSQRSTEVHRFTCHKRSNMQKMKRRQASPSNTLKRTKNH